MMKFWKFAAFFVSFALLCLISEAQSPAKTLKRAEQALGGEKSMRSAGWALSGTIKSVPDDSGGRFSAASDGNGRYREEFDIAGFEVEAAYNGRSAWQRDSRFGLRTLTGDEAEVIQAIADFRTNYWFSASKRKLRITQFGTNAQCDLVTISSPKGIIINLCIDRQSGVVRTEEFTSGSARRRFEYDDYRTVGTSKRPFRIVAEVDSKRYEITVIEYLPKSNAGSFDYPTIPTEPLPDLRLLLQSVGENQQRLEQMLENYSFEQKVISRELGKDGKLREIKSETRQISYYKGNPIRRVIEKNGKPLSEKEQAEIDREITDKIVEIDKAAAKEEALQKKGSEQQEVRISIAELLRASNLINPRRERFRGRSVIVFDFEPNPAFDYRDAKSFLKFFGKTAGVIWIDEADRQGARIEAFLVDSYNIGSGLLAKLKKGASFVMEQDRVNDEIWLPSLIEIDISARVLLFKGLDINQTIRSYNYRRFRTEVRDAEIREPAGKP